VADLLAHLGPAGPKAAVVSVNHVIAGPDRVIEAGAEVTVMQAMYGG
ncbi:MAG: MoaD/ThiS family protein, partial [Proteobacteria bacterium]|nr:MoaD/ThiS family protein [Pseudomonadota bacterium]